MNQSERSACGAAENAATGNAISRSAKALPSPARRRPRPA